MTASAVPEGNTSVISRNLDNTNAASHARFFVWTGGVNAGDPFIRFSITGASEWAIGSDNSDSDSFAIDNASALGAAPVAKWDSSGDMTAGGDIFPDGDDTRDLGIQTTAEWANVWATLINGADFALANDWRILESEKYKGYPDGVAFGNTGFEDGVVTDTMPDDTKPVFVITEEFIEWQGRRITPEALDKILALIGE